MIHHDSREYGAAIDETAQRFQRELEATIEKGAGSAGNLIGRIQREIPKDSITGSQGLIVIPRDHDLALMGYGALHNHAVTQLAARVGIPQAYVSGLGERGAFGRELLASNFNQLLQHDDPSRVLVRVVEKEHGNDDVRGILSDSYRRMDSRPIIEAFAEACGDLGVHPIEGVGGDLRWEIKAILPKVFRPGKEETEVVAFGLSLGNSDFGVGALSMRLFCLRIWCTNYAKLEEALRQIHLGKRLGESIEFSAKTYELDTQTMVSATRDLVGKLLAPERIRATVEVVGKAMDTPVEPGAFLGGLAKKGVLKAEVAKIEEAMLGGDVRMLPQGSTAYRMSNALSWVAKSATTAERRMQLEELAGEMLVKAA